MSTDAPRVTILGDGQMALVMADVLVEKGAAVRLYSPLPDDAAVLAETRCSPKRLPEFKLARAVEVTTTPDALKESEVVLNAIPTQFIRRVWQQVGRWLPPGVPIVCVAKGIENGTLLRPTEVISEVLGSAGSNAPLSVCALSGPTVATELARRMPATMVAASDDVELARQTQDLFTCDWLRIYRHDDPIGVELAGATKNVIALAAGMIDGLGVGDNAKSALLARGLAEISRLGVAMGARVETFFGVAGVGDLATTCFSPSGRNRTCGERIGRGESLDDILASTVSVVEGVPTARSVMALARAHDVDMPITAAVHAILFEGMSPRDAIRELMTRAPKAERIG